jgi:hypothetical protein
LCSSFCQKNLDLKYSIFFRTPFSTSKQDIMNIGKLDKTELINTNLPPYGKCFSFHPLNFFSILS